ncbi:hypothetical protein [Propioniciclava flava]
MEQRDLLALIAMLAIFYLYTRPRRSRAGPVPVGDLRLDWAVLRLTGAEHGVGVRFLRPEASAASGDGG